MGIFKQSIMADREREMPFFYFIASTMCIGRRTYTKMQSFFDSPSSFYAADTSKLSKTGIFTKQQITRITETKRLIDPVLQYENALKKGIVTLPMEDDMYPYRLREIKDAPPVLFLKGRLPSPESPTVSVIGTRECSVYGMNVANRLGEQLGASNVALISGMARGVDSISQKASIDAGGYSCAVLGGGVDILYPKESRNLYEALCEKGGIVSEFPPGTEPLKPYFALRNRIISGMSDVVCVIEAKKKSGTLITVDCALEQGREVYAVPGRITDITSFGTNDLIKQGAGMISNIDDFISDLFGHYCVSRIQVPEKTYAPDLSDYTCEEQSFISLCDGDSFTVDEMAVNTSLPFTEVMRLCLLLSAKAVAINIGGGRFSLTNKGITLRNTIISAQK